MLQYFKLPIKNSKIVRNNSIAMTVDSRHMFVSSIKTKCQTEYDISLSHSLSGGVGSFLQEVLQRKSM